LPPTAPFNLAHLAALGQAASPGRTRLDADAAAALAATRNRKSGCRATASQTWRRFHPSGGARLPN
jgi:hypothetical protein